MRTITRERIKSLDHYVKDLEDFSRYFYTSTVPYDHTIEMFLRDVNRYVKLASEEVEKINMILQRLHAENTPDDEQELFTVVGEVLDYTNLIFSEFHVRLATYEKNKPRGLNKTVLTKLIRFYNAGITKQLSLEGWSETLIKKPENI